MTPEEIQAKFEQQDQAISELQGKVSSLTDQNTTLQNTNQSLQDNLGALKKENETLKGSVSKLSGAVQNKPVEKEKPVIPTGTFTVGDKTYKFLVPKFNHKGEIITAQDALNDEEILEELVAKGSGLIKEVA